MNNFKKIFVVGVAVSTLIFYFGFNSSVNSNDSENVSGYAWEAYKDEADNVNGMGWLSFNCISGGDCGIVDYGVNIDDSGNMTGYAWSSNYGWVKVGGLSGFPSGEGTQAQNANLNGNNLKGWARFCAVFQSGCEGDYYHGSGPVDNNISTNPYLGGWDGWISLSGAGYGVNVDDSTGAFSDYAWGGGDVLGWIDFSQVITVPNYLNDPRLFLRANNNNEFIMIEIGETITLSSAGSGLNTTNGEASGDWSGSKICPDSLTSPTVYSPTLTLNTLGTYRYTLICDKADDSGVIESFVDVLVVESIIFCESNPTDPRCIPDPNPSIKKPIYKEN